MTALYAINFFSNLANVIFPILTIIGGGIAILAYGSNKVLRDTAADLRVRVTDLEVSKKIDREKLDSQATELKVWQKAVTGEIKLAAILDLLNSHHAQSVVVWERMNATMDRMNTYLNELNGSSKGTPK